MLLAVARRREREACAPPTRVARFGGDEFVVLAGDVEPPTDATQLAWRLTTCCAHPFSIGGDIGLRHREHRRRYCANPDDAAEDIIRKADATMYLAKRRGRSRVEVFGDPDAESVAS